MDCQLNKDYRTVQATFKESFASGAHLHVRMSLVNSLRYELEDGFYWRGEKGCARMYVLLEEAGNPSFKYAFLSDILDMHGQLLYDSTKSYKSIQNCIEEFKLLDFGTSAAGYSPNFLEFSIKLSCENVTSLVFEFFTRDKLARSVYSENSSLFEEFVTRDGSNSYQIQLQSGQRYPCKYRAFSSSRELVCIYQQGLNSPS